MHPLAGLNWHHMWRNVMPFYGVGEKQDAVGKQEPH